MRHLLARLLIVFGFGGFVLSQTLAPASAQSGRIDVMEVDGTINPVSARYLSRVIDKATEGNSTLLVLMLNTPGGLLSSTRDMVEEILESNVPVAVYVAPGGAQAASAGTFIAAAAHFAVMAPGTNIGAASPVASGGEDLPETLASKATQDAAAFIRSIAEERGRNVEALESTVLKATSFSAREALESNVVDFIAGDLPDLLAQLEGQSVTTPAGTYSLELEGLPIMNVGMTFVERFISIIANPDIAFLLLSIGGLGIMVEFLSPGVLFPGVFGAIALVLGFVALGNLPFSWAGAGLLAFSLLLFLLEFQAPGLGVFGAGGAMSFFLGAFLLFGGLGSPAISTPDFRVSLWLISTITAIIVGILAFVIWNVKLSRRAATIPALHTIVGQQGTVTSDLAPRGAVYVAKEVWSAVSDREGEEIKAGAKVNVVSLDGLTLRVAKTKEGEDDSVLENSQPV